MTSVSESVTRRVKRHCKECGKVFGREKDWRIHLRKRHFRVASKVKTRKEAAE